MKAILICFTIFTCVGCAYSQQQEALINKASEQLSKQQVSVNDILTDPVYMPVHSITAFRDLVKKYAGAGKLVMTTKDEPGKKITVKGKLQTKDGKAISGALVYVYQTSDKGWYSDTGAHVLQMEGDMRHARLFGYLKTNETGEFEFETIQPKGYPNSDLPAHIHIAAWKDGGHIAGIPGELLFDDDPRLTATRRNAALENGFLIEKNTGTKQEPVYRYTLISKD